MKSNGWDTPQYQTHLSQQERYQDQLFHNGREAANKVNCESDIHLIGIQMNKL